MRLARLVAAGLVLGAVIGFVAALVRPRGHHPAPAPQKASPQRPPARGAALHPSVSEQVERSGSGVDLPTGPLPLPTSPVLSGTGGSC